MIARYTRPEMGEIWTPQARFQCLLEVEVAVAEAQADQGSERTDQPCAQWPRRNSTVVGVEADQGLQRV